MKCSTEYHDREEQA